MLMEEKFGQEIKEGFVVYLDKQERRHIAVNPFLKQEVKEIKEKVRYCSMCFSLSDTAICNICSNPSRTASILCVVEQPADMVVHERHLGVVDRAQDVALAGRDTREAVQEIGRRDQLNIVRVEVVNPHQ